MSGRARQRYAPEAKPGGVVVVTRFDCRTIPKMLLIWKLHHQLKRRVYRKAEDFLGVHLILDWRTRTVRSISLWASLHGIYAMGEVPEHVEAVRIPGAQGIQTLCGIFSYEGDWLKVLFDARVNRPSPLDDWVDKGRRGAGSGRNGSMSRSGSPRPGVISNPADETGGSRSTPAGRPNVRD